MAPYLTGPGHGHARVLIVDDMPQVRRDLRRLLELGGPIEVIGEATNGAEAIELAAGLSPDVIVMDLEMPVMDGYVATCQIKANQPGVRVVILSVHAGPAEQQRAREAGADDFVLKGASYESLVDAILAGSESSAPPSPPN